MSDTPTITMPRELLERCREQLATLGMASSDRGIGPRTRALIAAIEAELAAGKEQDDERHD